MKLIDGNLFIEWSEMIEAGVSDNTLKKASHRNSPSWHFIKDPQDNRKVLIGYEELRDNYKEKINRRFGNPYDYVAREPIRKLVTPDYKAEQFFHEYRYDGDKFLPVEHRKKYLTAASWLNTLQKFYYDKKAIKKELRISVADFWENTCEIIKTDNIALPASYQRLHDKVKEYKERGYECLIDWRFGNKLSAKIGKGEDGFDEDQAEKQKAFILKAASMHNNFDAMQITRAVNRIFEKQGWPQISHGTVYNLIKENTHLVTPGSRGKREYNSNIAMQLKRRAPEFPLQYLTLDGWTVELLYQDETGFSNRLVAVIVLDAANKYPIGYAIGERENAELIRQANRNAAIHIQELFGAPYQPRQLQSDNFGLKTNTPFFSAMAHLHTPAAVGNAKAKIIEPYFKYLNKTYCQTQPNWSGFNITAAKRNQPNTEFLDKIKHSFPDKAGVMKQIEMIIARERQIKIEEYLSKWELLPVDDRLMFKREDFLMVFGKPTGFTNSITGQGLLPTINGTKYTYDTFDPCFRAMAHVNWQVIYDECDLSTILAVSEDGRHRFVLEQKHELPMAIHDMKPEDHQYLTKVNHFKKERETEIMETYVKNDTLVEEVMKKTPLALDDYDEATLKLMFTYAGQQKNRLQDAKGLKKAQQIEAKKEKKEQVQAATSWQDLQQDYLKSKTDFNQYLD